MIRPGANRNRQKPTKWSRNAHTHSYLSTRKKYSVRKKHKATLLRVIVTAILTPTSIHTLKSHHVLLLNGHTFPYIFDKR